MAFKSHPALATSTVKAAREVQYPSAEAMLYVNNILRFLSTIAEQVITYDCNLPPEQTFVCASDSAFCDQVESKSTVGWVCVLAGAAWTWGQEAVEGLSSTKVEYKGGAAICKQVLYARKLLKDFRLAFPQPCTVSEDNMGMVVLAAGPQAHHQSAKHTDVKYHMQRKLLFDGIVRYQHQDTHHMFADLLTKVLGRELFQRYFQVLYGFRSV